jgi:hypothetical protein
MPSGTEQDDLITRREAIMRVSVLLGGVALVGGSALLTGCRDNGVELARGTSFTPDDVGFLDEVAETILPATKTPGAKAARVGAFMALMVTDAYDARDQKAFRDGMRKLDAASRKAYDVPFVSATPQQRLALLRTLDREQKVDSDAREARARARDLKRLGTSTIAAAAAASAVPPGAKKADAYLPDERRENTVAPDANGAAAITNEPPAHYFRMMKELALLGYFTSELGCTKAQRYVESPGRFEPCSPYVKGELAWAPHA